MQRKSIRLKIFRKLSVGATNQEQMGRNLVVVIIALKAQLRQAKSGRSLTQKKVVHLTLKRLKTEEDVFEIEDLLCHVRSKRRKGDPNELLFLLDKESVSIDQEIALTLKKFRHKNTRTMLQTLLAKPDNDTREFAAASLLELYGQEVEQYLERFNDEAIRTALNAWHNKK